LRWIDPEPFAIAYIRRQRMESSMQLPLQITFRHMDSSDAVAARIRERSEGHRVVNGAFERFAAGDEVRFVAQYSERAKGPQPSTAVPLGKHHLPPAEAAPA